MKKFSLFSIIVILAMILAACGSGAETSATPGAGDALGTDAGLGVVTEDVSGGTGLATEDLSGTSDLATEVVPSMESTEAGALSTLEANSGAGTSIPNTGNSFGEFARLDQLMGLELVDANGSSLGSIQDFVISVAKNRVDYIVVDRGGQSVLVPWSTLAFDRANNAGFSFNGINTTFENAPAFTSGDFDFMNERWDSDLIESWRGGNNLSATGMPTGLDAANTPVATQDANSAQMAATQQPTQNSGDSGLGTGEAFTNTVYAVLASELENMSVVYGSANADTVDNGTGASTQVATEDPAKVSVTPEATSQNSAGDASMGDSSQQGESLGSIVGVIFNVTSGDVPYLLLSTDGIASTNSDAGSLDSGTSVANATQEPVTDATASVGSDSSSNSGSNTGSFADAIPVPFRMFNFVDENSLELPFQASFFSSAPIFSSNDFGGPLNFGWDTNFQSFWQQSGNNTGSTNP